MQRLQPAPVTPARALGPAGLTGELARQRLAEGGANAIPDEAPHALRRAVAKLWAPVPWMLEVAIALQLAMGAYGEAAVVGALLLFNAALGFVQEGRAQATLDALKSRLALVATVRRDGVWTTVPAATLVQGDLVRLSLGSVVAADVTLAGGSLLIDQSMLTGESLPVEIGAGSAAYAGGLVRRGEATAVVTATGTHTKFGRTAELIRGAEAESSAQKAIFRVVSNLVIFNGGVTVLLAFYAWHLHLALSAIVPLVLVAVLSSIPVALPSMFTLASAVGARALGRHGVLPTRLSAVDEAGGIDVLCTDKTGTLTRNELAVISVATMPGQTSEHVLALAALASSEGGQDPVDAAIRAAAKAAAPPGATLTSFVPFDPAAKRAEASVRFADGTSGRILKGAFAVLSPLCDTPAEAEAATHALEAKGYRVLALAAGAAARPALIGLIALSDPPRADAAGMVRSLADLGVRMKMLTGDAAITAKVVATGIGLGGAVCATTPLPENIDADAFAVFAGVLPEDKFRLVRALQAAHHSVGMCGDGANDAPALRQAQMGIAVSTATDVAKSAAGLVLTEPGLGGVVAAIREGRITYQRILTYTLRTIVHKVVQVSLLAVGLVLTGQAILTPLLMVLMMVTGDVLSMSSATDRVCPSTKPSVWNIASLSRAAIGLGLADLAFCVACLCTAIFALGLSGPALRSFVAVTLVFSGEALFYVSRERRHLWSSRPGTWLIVSSAIDLSLFAALSTQGLLMAPLPVLVVAGLAASAFLFAFVLDTIKLVLFERFGVA